MNIEEADFPCIKPLAYLGLYCLQTGKDSSEFQAYGLSHQNHRLPKDL